METRACSWCGGTVPQGESCPTCLATFPTRPAAESMTADERAAELRGMTYVEVPFDLIHKRIEQLVGRPVWTHEMAGWELYELLITESRWEGRPATFGEALEKIPPEKRVVIAGGEDDE